MRAKVEIEEKGQTQSIVVTELPYQVSAGAVARKIAELVNSRELEGIRDINDESSGDDTRFVITLKRDANPEVVLNNLWKATPLQTSFGVNMVALVGGVPRTLNLLDALQAYVDHQIDVITRRSQYRLDIAESDCTSSKVSSKPSTSSMRSSPRSAQARIALPPAKRL